MNEEEKKEIELDIEAKYVGKTEKEFLSRVTYAECLYILTPENEYCDEVIKLSVLKICGIIEKYKKQIEKLIKELKQDDINMTKKYKEKKNITGELLGIDKVRVRAYREKTREINEKLHKLLIETIETIETKGEK